MKDLKGNKNPNFKTGKFQRCSCGKRKRAGNSKCWHCKKNSKRNELIKTVKESTSYLEVADKLKTSRQTVKRDIEIYKLDISHFQPARNRYSNIDDLFQIGKKRNNGTVKSALLRENIISYKCSECGLDDNWNGKKLTLQLDHINGNPKDNRLENLRFLCPNCHSQTATYTGGNMKGKTRVSGGKE